MGPHKNLIVWKKSMELASKVYSVTSAYPQAELFGLTGQMRRCAISIPSNIAEGYGRGSNKDLVRFLHTALGSANELDTQLILSFNFGYLSENDFQEVSNLNEEVVKMLSSLIYKRTDPSAQPLITS